MEAQEMSKKKMAMECEDGERDVTDRVWAAAGLEVSGGEREW